MLRPRCPSRFRRSLATAIGRSHPDYQKLRAAKAAARDADDDTTDPGVAPPA